jgi:hypothetical protein
MMIAYYVSFGPHGPRAPTSKPGDYPKIFLAVVGIIGLTGLASHFIYTFGMALFCTTRHSTDCMRSYSHTTPQDSHQGMGGGHERACQGEEPQPCHRYVLATTMTFYFFAAMLSDQSTDPSLSQVSPPRVTAAKVLLSTSKCPAFVPSCLSSAPTPSRRDAAGANEFESNQNSSFRICITTNTLYSLNLHIPPLPCESLLHGDETR